MPENTNKPEAKRKMLMDALITGEGFIERQEAEGQLELCQAKDTTLPSKFDSSTKEALIKAGVKFGQLVEDDDMFINVVLPAGWKKQPTSHSMWSDLLDEKGRKRAAIFYKAAFYDRSANMYTVPRLHITRNYTLNYLEIKDEDKVIYIHPVNIADYGVEKVEHKKLEDFLSKQYPNFEDHSWGWDEKIEIVNDPNMPPPLDIKLAEKEEKRIKKEKEKEQKARIAAEEKLRKQEERLGMDKNGCFIIEYNDDGRTFRRKKIKNGWC